MIGRYCGNVTDNLPRIASPAASLWILFKTDHLESWQGFQLEYSFQSEYQSGSIHILLVVKAFIFYNNNIIICDIYIVPYSARSCSKVLYNIIIPDLDLFPHPGHISTPKGAYNSCCHYRRKALLKHIAIASCQVLIFFLCLSEPVAT